MTLTTLLKRPSARVLMGAALMAIFGAAILYRMGRHDVQALAQFQASYERFDETLSDQALNELRVKSTMSISSLTKNDGAMMNAARQVSDLAATEVSLIKASRVGQNDSEAAAALHVRLDALQRDRREAYTHFQRLLAAPPNSY